MFGVFEDDEVTGYLYLYCPDGADAISRHLFIYNRRDMQIEQADVDVVWSRDLDRVGVRVWGEMRGIMELSTGREVHAVLVQRGDPGIRDGAWLDGFDAAPT